ncbi:hypothetical protein H0H92_015631 [Tricholoma furcatifolium]|nr:hypothetical protein H0H92_015631 [Tricholoma furcatifolium]
MAATDGHDALPVLSEKVDIKESSDSNSGDLKKEDSVEFNAEAQHENDDAVYLNGEAVVTTGRDVSHFIVDIRDDGEVALTFRSFVMGTVMAGLGATLYQLGQRFFRVGRWWKEHVFIDLDPSSSSSIPGLLLLRRFKQVFFLFCHIANHVVATLVASTAAYGSTAVANFAVQRLYYNTHVEGLTAVLATFSTACFGYGITGILRPLTVYPSEMVYWTNLPTVAVFQTLHFDKAGNAKRLKLFWTAFTGMFCYEVIPAYIFPLLNGINIFCLASQHASQKTIDVFTNLFGGTDANEGLGFLSFSFDWQYIGSAYMSLPLIQQGKFWTPRPSLAFPMLSSSLFSRDGSGDVYNQTAVFGPTFQLNQTALQEVGLPALTGSNAWTNLTANLSIGGLIAHVVLFWGPYAVNSFKLARSKTQPDPHYQAMQKYKEAPMWWYLILLVLAFLAGLIVVLKGQTTLPWWSFIVALIVGSFISPFSTLLYARMGNGVATNQLMKMIAGAINPGRPVANLYFSMWSHDVVAQSIGLAGDLKIGQYLKIPPRVMFLTQVWGTILGAIINYVVMVSVVDAQREILLQPQGSNVWSGQVTQTLNSAAVTWSLAKELYGRNGPYLVIPLGLVIGMIPTTIQWLIWRRWPKIGPVQVNTVMLPIIYMYSAWMSVGVNSPITTAIIVGLVSQLWLRRYHPGWYKKYNYILGGAMDGGAQVMIFILSFAVFGASGSGKPFPDWAGNPYTGNIDYCNGNGALD